MNHLPELFRSTKASETARPGVGALTSASAGPGQVAKAWAGAVAGSIPDGPRDRRQPDRWSSDRVILPDVAAVEARTGVEVLDSRVQRR